MNINIYNIWLINYFASCNYVRFPITKWEPLSGLARRWSALSSSSSSSSSSSTTTTTNIRNLTGSRPNGLNTIYYYFLTSGDICRICNYKSRSHQNPSKCFYGTIVPVPEDVLMSSVACALPIIMSVQCLNCRSNLFLNAFTDGASITCCGRVFQLLMTLVLNNVLRAVVEHLGLNSFSGCRNVSWLSKRTSWKNMAENAPFCTENFKMFSDLRHARWA